MKDVGFLQNVNKIQNVYCKEGLYVNLKTEHSNCLIFDKFMSHLW